MWRAALLVVCACNQTFGLRDTVIQDAARPDRAAIDAAPSCPPIGTVPRFSTLLHQAVRQNCTNYTFSTSAGYALASCQDPLPTIEEGRLADTMTFAAGFAPLGNEYIDYPRLAPEGGEAIARITNFNDQTTHFWLFTRRADGVWTRGPSPLPFTSALIDVASTITSGPHRHLLVQTPSGTEPHEWVSDGSGGWTDTRTHSYTDLGIAYMNSPTMSDDGLRLLFYGLLTAAPTLEILYADRPSIDVTFGLAHSLGINGGIYAAMIAPDCSRVYFSALSSVFYAEQMQ